jgi:glycosyltransferase involved in cell wall biosynthesis
VELPQQITKIPKKNIIHSVGRFFSQLHSKLQDVLVEFFRHLCQIEPKLSNNWDLVLVGQIEDQEYANRVHKLAQGLPVTFHHQLNRAELLQLYGQAKIYWHATGFSIDVEREPAKVEHFGISTLEAMAAGAVPVVINLGGQQEIVTGELSRYLWNNEDECLQKTIALMKDEPARTQAAGQARIQSLQFSQAKFAKILLTMLER